MHSLGSGQRHSASIFRKAPPRIAAQPGEDGFSYADPFAKRSCAGLIGAAQQHTVLDC